MKHLFTRQPTRSLLWSIIYVMDISIGLFITIILYDVYGCNVSLNIRFLLLFAQIVPTLYHRIRLQLMIEFWCYYLGLLMLVMMEYYIMNFRSHLNICYPVYIIIFYLNEDIREIGLYHMVRICVKISILIEHKQLNALIKISKIIRIILERLFIHRKHFKQNSFMEMSMIGFIKFIKYYTKYGCHIKIRTLLARHKANRDLTEREQLIKECESEATAIINKDGALNCDCIEFANEILNIAGSDNMIMIEGGSTSISKADSSLKGLDRFQKKDTDLVCISKPTFQFTALELQAIGRKLSQLETKVKEYISQKFKNKLEINVSTKNQKFTFKLVETSTTRIIETDKSGDKVTAIIGNIERSNNEYLLNPVHITDQKRFGLLRVKVTLYCEELKMTVYCEILDISLPYIEYGGCKLKNKEWTEIKRFFNDTDKYITTPENGKVLIPKTIIKTNDYYRMLSPDYDRTLSESKRQQLHIRIDAMEKSMLTEDPKMWVECIKNDCDNIINNFVESSVYCKSHRSRCDIV